MSADPISVQWTLRGVIVRLPDEIDAANSDQVHTALTGALDAAPAVLVADMTGTTYCCSMGLGVLIATHRAAQRAGVALRVAGVHSRVRRILTVTGADQLLDIYPDAEAALAKSTAGPDAVTEAVG